MNAESFEVGPGSQRSAAMASRPIARPGLRPIGPLVGLGLALALSVLELAGCNPPPRPSFDELARTMPADGLLDEPREDVPPSAEPQASAETRKPFTEPWESWQSYHIAGRHIGYSHVRAEPQSEQPDSPIQITLEDQVMLRRGRSTIVQRLDQNSLETRTGELISFAAQLRVGPALTHFTGNVQNGLLSVVTTRGSKTSSQNIPWNDHDRGLVALQQSLLREPIQLGEQRSLRMLVPIHFAVAGIELNCQHIASIAMPDGEVKEGREVEVAMHAGDGQPLEMMLWTDASGKILKSYTPALDLIAYDSTPQAATENIVASEDILMATGVEPTGDLSEPQQASRVVYSLVPRSRPQDRPSESVIQPHPGQWVGESDEGAYRVLVSREPQPLAEDDLRAAELMPAPEDSASGPLINSDDPLVKQLAETTLAKQDQPLRLALDLAQTAHSLVRPNHAVQGFRPASTVAREGSGDSTAHAVLLAAMLRARGIPARVAVGLVYVPTPDLPRMVYHVWTIAHVEDRWVHLDATRQRGDAAADRITLGTHHLADGNPYEAIAPIIDVINQFDIEIVEASYEP